MRWFAARLGAAVSPTEKPMRASQTCGEGSSWDPPLERRPVSWRCVRGCADGRVPKRGRAVRGFRVIPGVGIRHSPSLVVSSRSSTVGAGSERREYASASVVVGISSAIYMCGDGLLIRI